MPDSTQLLCWVYFAAAVAFGRSPTGDKIIANGNATGGTTTASSKPLTKRNYLKGVGVSKGERKCEQGSMCARESFGCDLKLSKPPSPL